MSKNIKKLVVSTVLSLTVLTSFAMPQFIGVNSNIAYAANNKETIETFPEQYIEEGVYQIISVSSYKNLEVAGSVDENNTHVQIFYSNGTSAQRWKIKKALGGWYKIIAECSANNKCLDAPHTRLPEIIIYDDNAGSNQRWKFFKNSEDGSYLIASKVSDNLKVLDVRDAKNEDGTIVQLQNYNGNNAQKWILVKVG
ncbi:RICIN domain-containing protein [Anaerosacchariphilus polymeriproducens]|uniref:Ricin B lectin domain-containing protein n=1 Tax=Anaerosacchariphilus polymeriproducens TaxID=1812858 RepID=A0A371AY44_9FIRM|nr:RICIN domain-containing protein [Anaerosacchariphilus polymeriproducens]RDU24505.1 hypothetical protein DWV06_03290 [Anaerosacchariphilus polymeriproducens]